MPSTTAAFNLPLLIAQIVVVLLAARLFGLLLKRLGQPSVIGEMLAGIALGPSVFGAAAPSWYASLFAPGSLPYLNALSQVGVLLFLFVVGLHVDIGAMRKQGRTAFITSNASIAVPFLMGMALAVALFARYTPTNVSFTAFALFIGVSMSVTAFPVLARILEERRLLDTPIGSLAVACAAVGDVTAWLLLAVAVAMVKVGSVGWPLLGTIGGIALLLAGMFGLVQPWLSRLLSTRTAVARDADRVSPQTMSLLLLVALAAAMITERLGIHALFGAFVAGTIMPRPRGLADRASQQLSDLLVVLLLPLFFAYTGLRTRLSLGDGFTDLLPLLAILAVAIAGKVGGTAVAARASGESWYHAGVLGVLMNTRGLMELVVLNIGLDLGVLTPPLFAMLVIMALATTMMTVPLLSLVERWAPRAVPSAEKAA
jgi:Kef-type K+ transport system membrane component KefB